MVSRPHVLVLQTDSSVIYLLDTNATTGVPAAASAGANCAQWSEITIVCKSRPAGYKVRVWWYYLNSAEWVMDSIGEKTVAATIASAFVLNTGAASAVYVQLTQLDAHADNVKVLAEADK